MKTGDEFLDEIIEGLPKELAEKVEPEVARRLQIIEDTE